MAIRAEELELRDPDAARRGTVDIDRDRVLVLRHQRGDVEAFDQLYRRYHERLVCYCERRVGDRHVAEELAQEAFLRALRAMPRFAGERRFYPWMTVIAQRLCIDHHRKAARVEPTAEVEAGSVEPDHDALWAQVDRGHLTAAMERLAPRHREVLQLRESRGWSYLQIAHHLDVPMTTVEALLHRARKALRREFLSVGGDDRHGLPLLPVLAGAGFLARAKAWLAATAPARLVPTLAATAAGVAAIGVVAGTLAPADVPSVVRTVPAATAPASSSPATEPGMLPGLSVIETVAAQTPTIRAVDGAASPAAPAAPVTIDAGIAEVFLGPEGSRAAQERGEQLPIGGELGPVGYGIDPANIVDDTTELVDVVLEGVRP